MNNSTSLKTKWTMITTSITFIIFMLFSLFIIYFISIHLKQNEIDSAGRSEIDIGKLLSEKSLGAVTDNDILAAITEEQSVIIYDYTGEKLIEADDEAFEPAFEPVSRYEVSEEQDKGSSYIVVRAPVNTNNLTGYVTVVHSLKDYHALIQYMFMLASIFGITALFITAIISYLFSNQITKPIRVLSNQMKQIQRDGFQNKLAVPKSYYETDDMINTFNEMMIQLENSFNQQKQFVEDASHELRTPLQIIQGHLNLINRWGKNNPAVLEESLEISIEEMNRITKLVEELLLLSKDTTNGEQKKTEIVLVNDEIESRIRSLTQLHPDYHYEFHSSQKEIKLNINRYQFEQVMLIFLDNAMKYDQLEKHIIIRTSSKKRMVQIEVIDHGTGIPKKDIPNIFDRFYRVDKSRSREMGGNGLGLSIAKKIIESYNGNVMIESEVGQYTKVIVQFPER